MKTYLPASTTYRRIVREAARHAIQAWLRGLRPGLYLFEAGGGECALEFFAGESSLPFHTAPGGYWRWGRTDADEPGESDGGEDALLEVALDGASSPQAAGSRRRRDLPRLSDKADLTRAEIRALVTARARTHLNQLVLYPLPTN